MATIEKQRIAFVIELPNDNKSLFIRGNGRQGVKSGAGAGRAGRGSLPLCGWWRAFGTGWDGWCGLPVTPAFLWNANPYKSLALGS
jgi:hypothetical protein